MRGGARKGAGRPVGTPHSERARENIRVSVIIKRLHDHLEGKLEMSASQVRAAEILLRKTVPDLSVIDGNLSVEKIENVVYLPRPDTDATTWQERYAPKTLSGDPSKGRKPH
jgi:hypothetical protein